MWSQPKVDWGPQDRVNLSDYNRIKNNIEALKEMAQEVFPSFFITDMGQDISDVEHIWDIKEFNDIENNLETIFQVVKYSVSFGKKQQFYYNQPFIKYDELNRIERVCLNIYERLKNQIVGRRTLSFEFGGVQF